MDIRTELVNLYVAYKTWLETNQSEIYGTRVVGSYGDGIGPDFDGFMRWLEDDPQ